MVALELTQAAAEKGLKLLAKSEMPNGALRVAVRDGGCSGMRYELLFDETKGAEDDELEFYGLKVWVDPESAKYLDEITIDFSDTLNDAGFKVQNPKATETCGCGESFALIAQELWPRALGHEPRVQEGSSVVRVMIFPIRPYSLAALGSIQKLRSLSFSTRSKGWPVSSAIS